MLNDYQDHDEKTDPSFVLLSEERLRTLDSKAHNPIAALCADPSEHDCSLPASELAELVRVYRALVNTAQAQADATRIATEMVRQLEETERQVEAFEERGGRFEVLLVWTPVGGMAGVRWHARGELRWAGTFTEAREIVRSKYPRSSGQEAYIVAQNVRL
jgi:hypothetical protein